MYENEPESAASRIRELESRLVDESESAFRELSEAARINEEVAARAQAMQAEIESLRAEIGALRARRVVRLADAIARRRRGRRA